MRSQNSSLSFLTFPHCFCFSNGFLPLLEILKCVTSIVILVVLSFPSRLIGQKANILSTSWPFFRSSCKLTMNSCTGVAPDNLIEASIITFEWFWMYELKFVGALLVLDWVAGLEAAAAKEDFFCLFFFGERYSFSSLVLLLFWFPCIISARWLLIAGSAVSVSIWFDGDTITVTVAATASSALRFSSFAFHCSSSCLHSSSLCLFSSWRLSLASSTFF